MKKITSATVRADFNDPLAVVHYTRAAHFLGLWKSEHLLIERFFTDKNAPLLEAGCGSGRVTLGLWHEGYRNLTAFDFAEELVEQARSLAAERSATAIRFHHADATRLRETLPGICHLLNDKPTKLRGKTAKDVCHLIDDKSSSAAPARPFANTRATSPASPPAPGNPAPAPFAGALFMFNGLMQIPGRENRRAALCELHAVCRPGSPLLFTTHDRNVSPTEQALWRLEAARWAEGQQDPRLVEFGDRYFEDENGRTFMHLPDRTEILEDLAATGWQHTFDALRRELARESKAVTDFSDECRFWSAARA